MKPDLSRLSSEELKAELERREKGKSAPAPLPHVLNNYTALRDMIIEGVNTAIQEDRKPKDFRHYVWETAMEAVYGREFWTWWNALDFDE